MGRQLNTTSIVALVALAACLAWGASPASAGSLLSGYGGPGQGSQQVLGSTLLNEPSSGSGGPSSGTPAQGGERAPASERPAGARTSERERKGAGHAQAHGSPRSRGNRTQAPATRPAAPAASVSSQALGLSADDVMYIAVAVAALALTAALTRQLARSARQGR